MVRVTCLFLYWQIPSVFINLVYIFFLEQFFRLALSRLQNCGLYTEEDR